MPGTVIPPIRSTRNWPESTDSADGSSTAFFIPCSMCTLALSIEMPAPTESACVSFASTLNSPLGSASEPAMLALAVPIDGSAMLTSPFRSRNTDASGGHSAPVFGQTFDRLSSRFETVMLDVGFQSFDSAAWSVSSYLSSFATIEPEKSFDATVRPGTGVQVASPAPSAVSDQFAGLS
jgi:hypothetical protein